MCREKRFKWTLILQTAHFFCTARLYTHTQCIHVRTTPFVYTETRTCNAISFLDSWQNCFLFWLFLAFMNLAESLSFQKETWITIKVLSIQQQTHLWKKGSISLFSFITYAPNYKMKINKGKRVLFFLFMGLFHTKIGIPDSFFNLSCLTYQFKFLLL